MAAEKRVQELLGQMQKTLECSICLEMMKNPVSTGCGHQFCRFCLMEFLERKRQVPCPLCKKPITKRSLMKREQLGEMVEGVRSLISAFQKDTGALFSPPRGPQASLLPGTPDAIQTKSSTGNKAGKNTGQGNVRRTKRKQHVDLGNAESPSLIDSNESLPVTKSSDQITGEKSKDLSKKETKEEDRRLELLKCIEEGTLNADEFLEDNNVVTEKEDNTEIGMKGKLKSSSRNNLERQSRTMLVNGKCDRKVEINLKDCTKGNKDKKQSEDVTVVKLNSVKFKNAESIENKAVAETSESSVNDRSGDTDNENKIEIDPDEPVLSGASVAKESETSSGPLFKTPVDPRSLKHSKKGNDSSEHFEDISKKSLRSMDKKRNNDQGEVDTDGSGSVKLTPEVLVVKDKAVSRTYCKKDKDLFVKEKKATKKVADWLKNIPTIPNNANTVVDKDEITEVKERNQHRRLSKKKLKVMQEEEAMGSKIKHLAKQIQDNSKGVLFELDDFEGEDGNTVTDSTLRSDMEDVDKSLESDSQVCGENKNNNVVIDGKTGNFVDNDRTVDTDTEKNCNKDNQDIVEELSEDRTGTEKAFGKEPVRKKRIFKSRSVPSAQSFIDKATLVDNNKNINLQKTESKEENDSKLGNEIIEIESQESELPSSDPYEFKSSQNTPKKVGKKGKQKKGKVTNKAKGKQKRKENNVDVIQVQNKTGSKKFEKMWDMNLVPDKTILKTRNTEEIDKISASLQLAEDYDLLTCTQEAAESIAKEKEKSEAIASDVQKKVRFTEPVISDFIQTGKIDIIGYRKAREEFSVENNETGDEKNCEQKRKTMPEKCIEKKQIDVNDGENPLGQSSDATEDVESDDLSEDYRFHDDSSGTDDLDIEPTQEQFEKPNIDIQPEEIKAQLSQELLEDVVLETPLIPANKDSPNVNVIEETPTVFSVPKFNKILSKPVRKSRKLGKVNTSFEADTKAETPDVSIYEQHKSTKTVKGEMFDKDSEIVKMEKDKLLSKKETKEKCMTDVNISSQHEKMKADVDSLAESDETKSPDVELVLVQNTDKSKHEEYERMQVDNDQEAVAVTSQEALNSESTLTQNSESLLQPSALKAKTLCNTGQRTDIYEHTTIINTEKEMQKQYKPNSKDDKDALVPGGAINKGKPKKKRKSFMLEENEESLDFGSLSECVVVSVDEDSESVSKAKRQRVNRLRRSPKNKEKVLNDKSKDDTHSTDSLAKDIPENKEKVLSDKIKDNTHSIDRLSKDNESEVSGSIEIIPDTMAENDTAVNPLEDNDGNKIETDLADIEGINIIRNENNKKKTKKLKILNTCSINQSSSHVIYLSSSSESVSSLENSGNCEKKSERSPAEKSSKRGKGESQARKLCNSSETVDVIGETDMTNTGISGSEKKENFENLKIKENCKMVTNKFKNPNCLRSPKERKKRKSGQSEKDDYSQNDIVRIRHLSGMLVSPQESLVLSGMKDSVEDMFQIDSEMPSVDLSPVEGTLGLEPNSSSLDLGTLDAPDSVVNYNNTKKRKSLDQSELTLHETEENLIYKNGVKTVNEKEQSDSINLSPEKDIDLVKSKNEISLDQHSDSSPEEKRRRSNVKAVRGFSRKKRQSDVGQSQMSGSSSGNSVISRTPQALTSVKCKSPVVKFLSPKTAKSVQSKNPETGKQSGQGDTSHELNDTDEISSGKKLKLKLVENSKVKQKQTDTPVKALKETNVSKYSPSLVKQKKECEEKKEATFEPEVVELKHYDDEEDECVLSPNDLPDLDDENVAVNPDEEKVAVTVNPDFEITNDEQVRDKLSGRSKISPKLLLNSPDKVKNIVLKASSQNLSDRIENEYRTTIPETMSFDDDDDDEKCNHVKCDKTPTGLKTTENKQVNHVTEKVTSTGDDDNSIDSSSSPDFTLDSSSDDEHPEEQALTEISKFDKIVEHSIDTGKSNVLQNVDRNESKNAKFSYEKTRKKRRHKGIEKESFVKTRTPEHGDIKDQDDHESSVKGIAPVNSEDMYSTRLDSSPASCEEVNIDSEPVIVESDLDGDESENDNDRGVGDKVGDFGTANEIMELDNEGADDDDSDESDAVVRRKGVKRAILSDSSSEDEEEGSRHMNMTSSSAFSSQSENLTTQERYSLEKEVERMAREMEAMKEQLRRSKELNQSKQSDKKHFPNPVTVDDSDEDMIEANDSDNAAEDEDMFMSPPAITPGDLQMDDEETLDPAVVQDEENDVVDKGETVEQVGESLALPLESLTVPESDPSQLSRPGPVQGSDPSQSSHLKPVPESDPSQLSRPVLADLDTNITQSAAPNNKKPVGIVVTGLNVQQIQQTKKLAALTNAKFFTKFSDLVTHVIVKPADEDETICDRTLKFFQGIAKKCWIVNFFWVVDSRQVGHLLPEGPYEIQGDTANNEAHYGPRRSRLSGDKKLFKKFQFSLIGDNTFLSKDSMADLVETCGGDVCNMAHLGQGSRIPLVISCTDLDDEEEDLQFIVKHANDIYKGLGVVTVTREWILDSLTLYRVQPLQDYVVTDVPNLKLPRI